MYVLYVCIICMYYMFVILQASPVSLSVEAKNFGIDAELSNYLYVGGQVGLDLEVTVPGKYT